MTNNFIGVRQLATQLGVSIPTIRRWVHDGSLPCLKLNGTTVRFAPSTSLPSLEQASRRRQRRHEEDQIYPTQTAPDHHGEYAGANRS